MAPGRGGFLHGLLEDLGHSGSHHTTPSPRTFQGFQLPEIPEGAQTTLVLVPFPVTSSGPSAADKSTEDAVVFAVLVLAGFLWALPFWCINQRCCCRFFRNWVSRRLASCFLIGFVLNVIMISSVIAMEPDITANGLFFGAVKLIGALTANTEKILTRLLALAFLVMAFLFRKRIIMLLGYDQQLVRADFRDICTCFTMHRFRPIEVTILKVEGLASGSFGSRTLYVRTILGYNEAQHSRPHDNCTTGMMLKERLQLNYDPEDNMQKFTLTVKQQEVVGQAVSQMAPVAGAVMGAAINTFTFVGTGPGAALGAVTGVGAANSLGKEVARLDLSSAQVNRLREHFARGSGALGSAQMSRGALGSAQMSLQWRENNFQRVDLVPQGSCWLRISDVVED